MSFGIHSCSRGEEERSCTVVANYSAGGDLWAVPVLGTEGLTVPSCGAGKLQGAHYVSPKRLLAKWPETVLQMTLCRILRVGLWLYFVP